MRYRFWPAILIAVLCLMILDVSARAEDNFYTFKSALSSSNANWCMDIPGAEYQPGKKLALWNCAGSPNQTFGYESTNTLTAGGLCLDGLAGKPNQTPGAGDPVVIAECDGSDHQVWELQPFDNNQSVVAIVDPAGLCVTVDGANAARRTPLVLAQCNQVPEQGWLNGDMARPVAVNGKGGYVTAYSEPEYYWYTGHRYCWYDSGWHGGGWYWCGENIHQGIGWGGPIGWHYWYHHGHAILHHAVFFAGHHGKQGHQHISGSFRGNGQHGNGPNGNHNNGGNNPNGNHNNNGNQQAHNNNNGGNHPNNNNGAQNNIGHAHHFNNTITHNTGDGNHFVSRVQHAQQIHVQQHVAVHASARPSFSAKPHFAARPSGGGGAKFKRH